MSVQQEASTEVPDGPVQYVRDGAVAVVTLARPQGMNALDTATKVALLRALQAAAGDPEVRAVVLTGSGRAFCVGQDLVEHVHNLQHDPAATASTVREHYNPIVELLATMAKPVVAAVNGVAAGAGAAFAFACDFRVVADTAGFNLAFAGVALSCDSGSSWSLPRLVGVPRALDLLYFPRTVPAAEALEIGLATSVVPVPEVVPTALVLAQRLAAGPTVAYGAMRRSVAYAAGHDLDESLAFEGEMMALTGATQDHVDAVRAFTTKTAATYAGR